MSFLRQTAAGFAIFCAAGAAQAQATVADLAQTLKLDEVAALMRDEGLSYAGDLERDMLPGGGGALFHNQVQQLYDVRVMVGQVTTALERDMRADLRESAIAFFKTEDGQSILSFENAARAAMAQEEIEEIARAAYTELKGSDDARLATITRFVEVNDLIERNVAGALSSNFQFYQGLADGGAYPLSEDGIAADVWAQEPEIRADTESWLFAYLLLAYQPLSTEQLDRYLAFSSSDAGQALNAALFAGFDRMYRDISYGLGQAAAIAMQGSDL